MSRSKCEPQDMEVATPQEAQEVCRQHPRSQCTWEELPNGRMRVQVTCLPPESYFQDYFTLTRKRIYDPAFGSSMRPESKPQPVRAHMQVAYGILAIVIAGVAIPLLRYHDTWSRTGWWLFLFVGLGAIFGWVGFTYSNLGKKGRANVRDIYLVDIWSIGHLLWHSILTLALFSWLGDYWLAFWITMGIAVAWEVGEFLLSYSVVRLRTIYEETFWNSLSDLVFGLGGQLIVLGVISF